MTKSRRSNSSKTQRRESPEVDCEPNYYLIRHEFPEVDCEPNYYFINDQGEVQNGPIDEFLKATYEDGMREDETLQEEAIRFVRRQGIPDARKAEEIARAAFPENFKEYKK